MNALMWAALGFSIWICLAMFVLALGKAAARADQEWDELEDAEYSPGSEEWFRSAPIEQINEYMERENG